MSSLTAFFTSRPIHARSAVILLILIPVLALVSGCGDSGAANAYQLAPLSEMHAQVQAAPVTVQQAYQFAHANPDVLKHIPCYCGCGAMGHTSNYSCYINEAEGDLAFDNHALGCSICVDITQDVMRLMNDGQPLADIRTFIDNKYAAFGPSNIP